MGIFSKNLYELIRGASSKDDVKTPATGNHPVYVTAADLSVVNDESIGFDPYDTASLYVTKSSDPE